MIRSGPAGRSNALFLVVGTPSNTPRTKSSASSESTTPAFLEPPCASCSGGRSSTRTLTFVHPFAELRRQRVQCLLDQFEELFSFHLTLPAGRQPESVCFRFSRIHSATLLPSRRRLARGSGGGRRPRLASRPTPPPETHPEAPPG